ncbi:AraC family transcriptional regulator [Pseudomonas sp. Gutcm_11s]|uniref:AraC family transcriptional regulator n=1 Tax=Pseudomonas sp. Gutcm_11s TaxID=3026088 RepID=UPI00236208AF|nr:AraC family transcriptional regulator [Pseudomonas sp. Gutcm_11s]MDD0841934.1 AraC family transcriptional regulator [Pseudomonas sp. Gutcm_11s]
MSKPLTLSSELVPITYAEALLQLAGERGIGRERLLGAAGIRPEQLQSPSGRLSFIDFHQLAATALVMCEEPALGLLLGLRLNASAHGILGYALLSSANLGKAVHFALRYYRVLGLTFDLELVDNPDSLELRASESIPLGALGRFAAEGLFGSLYAIAQFLLGEPPQGLEIGFAYAEPEHAARYHETFGVAVQFDQPWHWFRLPRHYLERPMALANPATMQMCEQQCEALLATLNVQEGLLSRLRRLLLARPGDFPNLDSAASALHTSGRSLRRHLATAGTSYQQVLDEVRKRLALQYLETTHLPVFEIALLLGFSDQSNFRRAFRKWTGRAPKDYRARPVTAEETVR